MQSAQADDVEQIRRQSRAGLLQRGVQGVNITPSQGNPWQANLFLHRFTLSPLLSSPSGTSVYADGVRQNDSFAGTMNWEMIPDLAVRNVELISGARNRPLFTGDPPRSGEAGDHFAQHEALDHNAPSGHLYASSPAAPGRLR